LKNPLLSLIFILFACSGVLSLYAFLAPQPLEIAGIFIKKSGIENLFTHKNNINTVLKDSVLTLKKDSLDKGINTKNTTPPADSSRQIILLTGDSMCEGLMFPFIQYARYNGHILHTVIWYSSSTMWWAEKDSLQKLIQKFKPTLVIFNLGSNELFIRNIRQEREKYVQDIIAQAGKTRFIWVGPPNWAKDTGINQMLLDNLKADHFFVSKDITFQRGGDGRHPSRAASRMWADTLCRWIVQKSCCPVVLEKPVPPRQNLQGTWLQNGKVFWEIAADSLSDTQNRYAYGFGGSYLTYIKKKQRYRANILLLSRDSLVVQDHEGIMRFSRRR
jgi:hypothetical protein